MPTRRPKRPSGSPVRDLLARRTQTFEQHQREGNLRLHNLEKALDVTNLRLERVEQGLARLEHGLDQVVTAIHELGDRLGHPLDAHENGLGALKTWLKLNFALSQETARQYMKFAREAAKSKDLGFSTFSDFAYPHRLDAVEARVNRLETPHE